MCSVEKCREIDGWMPRVGVTFSINSSFTLTKNLCKAFSKSSDHMMKGIACFKGSSIRFCTLRRGRSEGVGYPMWRSAERGGRGRVF